MNSIRQIVQVFKNLRKKFHSHELFLDPKSSNYQLQELSKLKSSKMVLALQL